MRMKSKVEMSDAHIAAAQKLIASFPGYEVRAELEKTNVKLSSLSSTMSRVRSIVVEAGHRHPEYEASTVALRAYESDPAVAEFLTAPLSKQLSTQRSHAATPSWSEEMETALAAVKLLPSNMDTFALTRFESLELKRQQETALLIKNETVIVVQNAGRVLKRIEEMLESAPMMNSTAVLAIALLIVSGRRTSEILNGRSTFQPVPGDERSTLFSGQLKKRGEGHSYTIPLLVPYTTFARGIEELRRRQGGKVEMTNREVSKEYSMPIKRELQRCERGRSFVRLPHLKPHDLRSMYMAFVWQCFQCQHSFPRTCMRCLGHVSLAESLSYANVRVEGVDENAFGPLTLH